MWPLGYKGSCTGAHAHLPPSPKVQGHRQGTPGLALWVWFGCKLPKSLSCRLESGSNNPAVRGGSARPGEAAMHACLHTHTCSAGVLGGGARWASTAELCWCQSRFQSNL